MEYGEINEDEFDFHYWNDVTSIHKEINDRKSNDEDGDEIKNIKRRKIRIIDNECESEDIAEDAENFKWITCPESENISRRIRFVPGEKSAEPQISSNISELLDFC